MNETKRVILESDDFGITPKVSEAIIYLLRKGKISATNCMPTIFDFDKSVKLLKNQNELQMGIHLIADSHLPALDAKKIPTITKKDGHFLSFDELIERLNLKMVDYGELESELIAQIELAKSYGIKINHITTHHGFMNLNLDVFKIVTEIASKYDLPLRNNITSIDNKLAAKMQKIVEQKKIKMAKYHFTLTGKNNPIESLLEEIDNLPSSNVLEVVSHVGFSDKLLSKRSSYTKIRERDYETLNSKALAYELDNRNAKIVDFSIL